MNLFDNSIILVPFSAHLQYDIFLEPDEKEIERILYMSSTTYQNALGESIRVIPGIIYKLSVGILQSGLGNDLAQLSDIKLNGISFGDCNPSGSEIACSLYNCFDDNSIKEVTSYTGSISVVLIYRKVPQHICDCNLNSWACSPKSGYSGHIPNRAPTRAAAKINLTPIRNMKGEILIFHPNLHFGFILFEINEIGVLENV